MGQKPRNSLRFAFNQRHHLSSANVYSPPTIPTLPLRRTSPKRVVKTYFVGIIQPDSPRKSGRAKSTPQKPDRQKMVETTCDEAAEIENRIAYRAERASRYASDRAFPVLTSNHILPQWSSESVPDSPKESSKESSKKAKKAPKAQKPQQSQDKFGKANFGLSAPEKDGGTR